MVWINFYLTQCEKYFVFCVETLVAKEEHNVEGTFNEGKTIDLPSI